MFKKAIFTILSVFLFSTFAFADNVVFVWDPNTESDLAGYRLYQSKTPGVYIKGVDTAVADIPAGTHTTGLQITEDGKYYWVLTAYDEHKNESDFSNEVSKYFDLTAPAIPSGFKINITVTITGE